MATQAKRDYYEILSVSRTATEQEIKSSYRKLAMQWHPDRNPGNAEAEEKFKECTEAYSVLMDADKRARYDQYGHAAVNGGGFSGFDGSNFADVSDIFGDIFSDFFGVNVGGGRGGRTRVQRGGDARADITLTFEEAAFGKKTQAKVRRYEACEQCKGTGPPRWRLSRAGSRRSHWPGRRARIRSASSWSRGSRVRRSGFPSTASLANSFVRVPSGATESTWTPAYPAAARRSAPGGRTARPRRPTPVDARVVLDHLAVTGPTVPRIGAANSLVIASGSRPAMASTPLMWTYPRVTAGGTSSCR